MNQDLEDDFSNIDVTIFNVPKSLRDTNPNAYTPQLVSIGPYHYFRLELQQMEKYKISSAKRIQILNRHLKFDTIVNHFLRLQHKIRACYHRYLDINSQTLALIMAIDAAFLIEIIDTFATEMNNKILTKIPSRISQLVDYASRKSIHNDILRDIIMLENQIPLFVLRDLLQFGLPSPEIADKILGDNLIGLHHAISPFKLEANWETIQPCNSDHLLDLVYRILVPKLEEIIEISENGDQEVNEENKVYKLIFQIKRCLGQLKSKIMFKLPWMFISHLPGLAILRAILFPEENLQRNLTNQADSRQDRENSSPLVEEIMIPSVIELSKCGVSFIPTNGNILTINFDKHEKKCYLPVISIDVNTEVVLRNLVAYEASLGSGPLILARYTELMNGIIDTKEDARLLREQGIIYNYLKSDQEIADMWNGMSKSLRLTRVPFLDEVIDNVNKYYEANWKVVLNKFLHDYAIHSWQFLAFLLTALIFFLLLLQVFCNLLLCPRRWTH
ncbi:putative UPF0481 protein At3g02645 [Silene latifolia]|uniref:putative UPF0481 protein At3g02645 n=1 Tax=Silene latifolia TaxID=37657 RepID=UPI003D77D85F